MTERQIDTETDSGRETYRETETDRETDTDSFFSNRDIKCASSMHTLSRGARISIRVFRWPTLHYKDSNVRLADLTVIGCKVGNVHPDSLPGRCKSSYQMESAKRICGDGFDVIFQRASRV